MVARHPDLCEIARYVDCRTQVAEEAGLTEAQLKEIINSIPGSGNRLLEEWRARSGLEQVPAFVVRYKAQVELAQQRDFAAHADWHEAPRLEHAPPFARCPPLPGIHKPISPPILPLPTHRVRLLQAVEGGLASEAGRKFREEMPRGGLFVPPAWACVG
jgi:hypothetical protein